MHKFMIPAALLAGFGATVPANAATSVGTVAVSDPATMRLTLADGNAFAFPDLPGLRVALAGYRPGDVVVVTQDRAADSNWVLDAIWPDYERVGNHPR